MARMMIKFEVLKDPRYFDYKDKRGVNLWVQDLDNEKLKLPITGFDVDKHGWGNIRIHDRFNAECTLGKRKNDRSGEWEYQFIAERIVPVGGRKPSDEEQFIADIAEAFPPEEEEDADLPF